MKGIITGLILVLLVSCNGLREGVIIDKWYEEGKMVNTVKTSTGVSTSGDIVVITTPTQEWQEEQWIIRIEGKIDDKLKRKTLNISRVDFNRVNIGDYWVND